MIAGLLLWPATIALAYIATDPWAVVTGRLKQGAYPDWTTVGLEGTMRREGTVVETIRYIDFVEDRYSDGHHELTKYDMRPRWEVVLPLVVGGEVLFVAAYAAWIRRSRVNKR
jgi:hypothetical protein